MRHWIIQKGECNVYSIMMCLCKYSVSSSQCVSYSNKVTLPIEVLLYCNSLIDRVSMAPYFENFLYYTVYVVEASSKSRKIITINVVFFALKLSYHYKILS